MLAYKMEQGAFKRRLARHGEAQTRRLQARAGGLGVGKRQAKGGGGGFTLHDGEGCKAGGDAGVLGDAKGEAKAQLDRARMLLREALNR